jgi:hypothetical protein
VRATIEIIQGRNRRLYRVTCGSYCYVTSCRQEAMTVAILLPRGHYALLAASTPKEASA